ncbi:MAG: TatD family hydrolase [Deltaproteobacteria bacterium]|nr:TatD family hydrolase [Deltaproteobacteria bacterium]
MKLFDSHCHLDDSVYDPDFEPVLERARNAGVSAMMIAGINLKTSQKAVALSEAHEEIFASVGFHPHDASDAGEPGMEALEKLASHPRVLAWGEIGLDFNRMHSPRDIQEKWLIRQLEVADRLDLPVIFHERESSGRLLDILKQCHQHPGNGVIHCFSGTPSELTQYLDLGYFIGITGILTIQSRGTELRKLATRIPRDRILIETDAPYLTPAPEKNHTRRNEPAFVRSVLMKLAKVREEDPDELANALWNNTCRLFRVPLDMK